MLTAVDERREMWVNCDCSDFLHSFRVEYWDWEDKSDSFLCMDVGLPPNKLLGRIWTVIKYVLKVDKAHSWAYCSVNLSDKDADRLIEFLQKYVAEKARPVT